MTPRVRPDARLTSDGDRVERRSDGSIYLMSEDGWRYRVYDVYLVNGRVKKAGYESPYVTHRLFVSADKMRRTYTFGRGERLAITASALERQLKEAKFHTEGPFANRPPDPR